MAQYEYQFLTEGSGSYINDLAAEAITKHALCYFDPTGNGWLLADADAASTMPVVGISMAAIPTTRKGRFLLKGFIGDAGWTWTPNGIIYASTVAGQLTQTPPAGAGDTVQAVGIARTSTIIWFDPAGFGGVGSGQEFSPETAIVGFNGNLSSAPNYFLCDGTADEVQINQAIAYVGALGGGSVFLERGTYTLSSTVTMNQSDVVLVGQGWDTIIDGGLFATAITISQPRCMVKDVQVKTTTGGGNSYDGVNVSADDCIVEKVFVNGSDRVGILVNSGSDDCLVTDCYVFDSDTDSIFVDGARGRIVNNFVEQAGFFGISVQASGDGTVIDGNTIDTTDNDGIFINSAAENCTVTGNTILNWTGQPVDDDSDTSVVADNNCGGDVMNSKGCAFATVQASIDHLNGDGWVEVPDGTFSEALVIDENNVILRGRGWGSIIDGGTTGHAITLSGFTCVVRDMRVKTTAGGGNAYNGIEITNGFHRIINVRVDESDNIGINVDGDTCKIDSCLIQSCDAQGVLGASTGDNLIVSGNHFRLNTGNDVELTVNCDNCVVTSNRAVAGAIVDNSGTSTVANNDVT